jgi:AmiR/NasT family two-component response regulator
MSTMRCDPDAAWQLLKTQSQAQNIKLREIATEIVNNASRPVPGIDD